MLINNTYAQQVAQARANNTSVVHFNNSTSSTQPIAGEKDTLTLSGNKIEADAPTYIRPITARTLLAQHEAENPSPEKKIDENRFNKIMQNIVDKRLGIDREKLKELEAMMEKIANNDDLSPEDKQKALEELAEIREKIIKESQDIREMAKQSDADYIT